MPIVPNKSLNYQVQDSIQGCTLHFVVVSLWSPPIWSIPQPVLDLCTLDTCEGKSPVLQNLPLFGLPGLACSARPGCDVVCLSHYILSDRCRAGLVCPSAVRFTCQALPLKWISIWYSARDTSKPSRPLLESHFIHVYVCEHGIRTLVLLRGL